MASKKPAGLGRGLNTLGLGVDALGLGIDALLGDDVQNTAAGSLSLPISQVESCSSQPRKHFDEAALAELEAQRP